MPYYETKEDHFTNLVIIGIELVIIAILLAPVTFVKPKCQCEVTELVALKDRFGTEGEFFLGAGVIDEEGYYVFYRKEEEALVFDKIQAEGVKVYEENRNNAIMEECFKTLKFSRKPRKEWWKIWKIDSVDSNCDVKFRVPKGTVKRLYKLDLEN